MIMDKLINSGILTLSVVLLAIVAIIFLFLKYRQNDGKCKVHMYYISGLLIFIIIELITYVCVNSNNTDQIVDYISFASTISSLFLSVVAIIYAIVSNNQGEAQYQKIDKVSDRISISVDKFLSMSESLSQKIIYISSQLEDVKITTNYSKNIMENFIIKQQSNEQYSNVLSEQITGDKFEKSESPAKLIETIIDGYINSGSYFGNIVLLACVFSYKNKRPFSTEEINPDFSKYLYAYIVASTALGIVSTRVEKDKFVVYAVLPILEEKLIHNIENFISSSDPKAADYNKELYEHVKRLFGEDS